MIIHECPECGNTDTVKRFSEWNRDTAWSVYGCDTCKIEFEVTLGNPVKEVLEE